MTLPNVLTLLRIILTPAVCLAIYTGGAPARFTALGLFIIASATDFFDGYIAEKTNSRSAFGALMDPLADKILVISTLLFLISAQHIRGALLWFCLWIVIREILILGLRGAGHELPVTMAAKWKTAFQMLAICFYLLPNLSFLPAFFLVFGPLFLCFSALLSAWSSFEYVKKIKLI